MKILLISDRVNCSPEMMYLIKTDNLKVISKYMKIDAENIEIQISTVGSRTGKGANGKHPVLYANIPILDVTAQEQALNVK